MTSSNPTKLLSTPTWQKGSSKKRQDDATANAQVFRDDEILSVSENGCITNIIPWLDYLFLMVSSEHPELAAAFRIHLKPKGAAAVALVAAAAADDSFLISEFEKNYVNSEHFKGLTPKLQSAALQELLIGNIKDKQTKSRQLKIDSNKLFFTILAKHMSDESLRRVRNHKDFNENASTKKGADHSTLVQIALETHLVGFDGSKDSPQELERKKNSLVEMWIAWTRPDGMQLCEFQRHMTSWFKALEIAKANLAQTTSDQVIAVFRKWGDEELLLEFEIGSRPEYPDTLTKAYDLLLRVSAVKARRSSKPPPNVSSPPSIKAVFVAALAALQGKEVKTSKTKASDFVRRSTQEDT
jgi:hypothetical protein